MSEDPLVNEYFINGLMIPDQGLLCPYKKYSFFISLLCFLFLNLQILNITELIQL
uniref:Uncharacterized protein n=1 Tax=Lepeophtheirus salmonis TaxID=72036 RepID=A0A0K2UZ37_LEPSM